MYKNKKSMMSGAAMGVLAGSALYRAEAGNDER